MMKINKITFKGKSRILNPNEMKSILGGQTSMELCHMSSGSGFAGSGDFDYSEIVCEGVCLTETVSGNTEKKTCSIIRIPGPVGKPGIYMCDCK